MGERVSHEHADFSQRVIVLSGTLDMDLAGTFWVAFSKTDETPGPIKVVLMCMGGAEPAGWAIHDTIRQAHNPVIIDVMGAAFSMAVAVLQAGAVRRMGQEARLMIHAGNASMSGESVDQRTLSSLGSEAVRTNLRYAQVLAARSGKTLRQIETAINKETYFSAEEALRYGLIDAIIPYLSSNKPKRNRK